MIFGSILFENGNRTEDAREPECFPDLNLDQIVAAAIAGKEEYDLAPFFRQPLHDVDTVTFRHEVMRDLEEPRLFGVIKTFAQSMHAVRENLAQLEQRFYERQKERWFLDAVTIYGTGVNRLAQDLVTTEFQSRGLLAFREYVREYVESDRFTSVIKEAQELETALAAVRYRVLIQGPRVEVRAYDGAGDYSAEVETTFERFQQGTVGGFDFKFSDAPEMNHIEAQILDGVAHLNPQVFEKLAAYFAANKDFRDPTVVAFDREIQFYVSWLDYIARFKKAGLPFCYPRLSDTSKEFRDDDAFDLALAEKLSRDNAKPVMNDFYLTGPERVLVVTGPNQGGKTTTARTFGQLHYLGSLGCPVPGTRAQLYLPDQIFTHFERQEQMTSLRGKLEDDLIRIHSILQEATPHSIVIINEIFASTTLRDALFLSKKTASAIIDLDLLCVWITFLDEVASLGPQTVSMVTTVIPDNPAQRTFRVLRRPADGLAHAMAIAEKYRLTYDMIRERIRS